MKVRVDGKPVEVPAGATVAAAVSLAGVTEFRQSVSGEPRGPVCGMGICFECRVTIDGREQARSCQTPCREGMEISIVGRPFGARGPGFRPAQARRKPACGAEAPPHDVVIIGAGPAGLAAARRAQEAGASVAIVDDNPAPGGQIWRGERIELPAACKLFSRASVVAAPAPGRLTIETADSAFDLSYRALILATGARERFLPFPGWTLPHVTGAGGLQALVKGGMPIAGRRVVVAGSGPLLLAVAHSLRTRGAKVALVAEQADGAMVRRFGLALARHPAKLWQAARLRLGLRYLTGCWPVSTEPGSVSCAAARARGRSGAITWRAASGWRRMRNCLRCSAVAARWTSSSRRGPRACTRRGK